MKQLSLHIIIFLLGFIQLKAQDTSIIDRRAMQALVVFNLKTLNTAESEFAPALFKDGIIYAGMPPNPRTGTFLSKKQRFYNLYYVPVNAFGIPNSIPEEMSALNSPFHEGPVSFDQGSARLYFTRTNAHDWQTMPDSLRDVHLQIYTSTLEDGKWSEPVKIAVNSDQYSICHPSINKKGDRLYFASNMEGGYGGMDIYYSEKEGDSWGKPVNAGAAINTIYNDWFPFIHASGNLFFCSDGHYGYGGLDIYVSKYLDGSFTTPQNLGNKLNNAFDQAGFTMNDEATRGYFSSEDTIRGNDNLYLFDTKFPIIGNAASPPPTTIESLVQVRRSGALRGMEGLDIQVYDLQQYKANPDVVPIGRQISDLNGYTAFEFKVGQKLIFQATEHGKQIGEWIKTAAELIRLDLEEKEEKPFENVEITSNIKTATITSGAVISLDNIYYDYNKADIKPGAAEELEILAKIMQDYPVITIILTAHTDSRGTELFNQKLSEDRAAAAKAYLLNKGIDGSRISVLGMGESRLRNHCADGVECTEQEHQYNRRTEVRIVTAPAGIEIKYQN